MSKFSTWLGDLTAPAREQPASSLKASKAHIPGLDGLRACAIALVVISHLGLGHIIPGGFGVTLFFFISGFLITRLLLAEYEKERQISLSKFYARRFFRLAPALLFFCTVCVAVFYVRFGWIHWPEVLSAIFYIANYYLIFFYDDRVLSFGLLWSLAVEEHFYLLYPLVFVALASSRRVILILALACAAACMWRVVLLLTWNPPHYSYMATDARFDSICFGVILAFLLNGPSRERAFSLLSSTPAFFAGVAILLLTFLIRDDNFRETFRYSLQGLALMPIVSALLFSSKTWVFAVGRTILENPLMSVLGKLSYSLYLWHWASIDAVDAVMPSTPDMLRRPLQLALMLAISAFSYYVIERAFLTMRRRFGSVA